MKTSEQERRALAERQANADASAAGEPMPFPNIWDALLPKLDPAASRDERLAWYREFAARHEPRSK